VCEAILRGRRGEAIYDMDDQLLARTETQFGRDVQLTLDIELQKKIEEYLAAYDYDRNDSVPVGMAAVVVEIASGDILALVSLPNYDLNRARYDYGELIASKSKPFLNRAVNELYPPGSVAKPLVLIAGMESGKITADEVISCPAEKSPQGWPNCWVLRSTWRGHNDYWQGEGGNKARNAIRGSCNIYFSRLADRLEPQVLQQWLFAFGYGRAALPVPATIAGTEYQRNLRQAAGLISSSSPKQAGNVTGAEQLPALLKRELRFFGIGQGSFRVTPLQVANAMAAIARGGVYAPANLYLGPNGIADMDPTPLGVSAETIGVVCDGMHAVVSEPHGTAYEAFSEANFAAQGIRVYGKTGSTTEPEHAWFGGFARDRRNRGVAIAVALEGGQSGGHDAAPAGRDIISFCMEAGYIGSTPGH
jgi:penicillin-binding protein 2